MEQTQQNKNRFRNKCLENSSKSITIGLFAARRHTGQEVGGRHVDLVVAVSGRDLDRGKVTKHFVRRGEVTNAVLVFNDLLGHHGRAMGFVKIEAHVNYTYFVEEAVYCVLSKV